MAKVFVSYSRKDIEFAKRLTAELQKSELDFWIDWEGIPPTVDWWREIEKGIEEADVFIFLISPDSAKSKICGKEIDCAVKNGKRIIPIVVREIQWEDTPPQLGHLNYIFFSRDDDFDTAVKKLMTAIQTDYEWAATHRRLQVKALDWERNNKEGGFLLRSKDLLDAESDLATNSSKEPHPTDLQREYVFASRKAADRQRRIIMGFSIGGVIALAALAILALVKAGEASNNAATAQAAQVTAESNASIARTAEAHAEVAQAKAEKEAKISRAGQLTAQAELLADRNFQNSILLAVEAFTFLPDDAQTRGALLNATIGKPDLTQILTAQTWGISSVAFSPDGKTLASGSFTFDNNIILWDVETGKALGKPLDGHKDNVTNLVFSPDGKTLASSSHDEVTFLWDVETRQQLGESFSGKVTAFSSDSKFITSANTDGSVAYWNAITGKSTGQSNIRTSPGSDITLSPDGQKLAVVSDDGSILLWFVSALEPSSLEIVIPSYVYKAVFSPNSQTLVVFTANEGITFWNADSGEQIGQPIKGDLAAFSPDGRIMALRESNTITLWDLEANEPIGELQTGYTRSGSSLSFGPDGKTLALGGWDGVRGIVLLWDISHFLDPNMPQILSIRKSFTGSSAVFSPHGDTIAISRIDGNIEFLDAITYRPTGISFPGTYVAFNPKNSIVAIDDPNDPIVHLWDLKTAKPIGQKFQGYGATFSPNGSIFASLTDNGVILWDVATGEAIGKPFTPDESERVGPADVKNVVFSPDGSMLVLISAVTRTGEPGGATLFDISKLHEKEYEHHILNLKNNTEWISNLIFSPDGKLFTTPRWNGSITLWSSETLEPISQPLTGHSLSVDTAAFSPDSKYLASAGRDGDIVLWDIATRQPIGQPLTGHFTSMYSLAFSPDGNTLASGSQDFTIFLWDLNPNLWIQYACQRAGRNFTRAEWEQYGFTEPYRKTCEQWDLDPEPTATSTP